MREVSQPANAADLLRTNVDLLTRSARSKRVAKPLDGGQAPLPNGQNVEPEVLLSDAKVFLVETAGLNCHRHMVAAAVLTKALTSTASPNDDVVLPESSVASAGKSNSAW